MYDESGLYWVINEQSIILIHKKLPFKIIIYLCYHGIVSLFQEINFPLSSFEMLAMTSKSCVAATSGSLKAEVSLCADQYVLVSSVFIGPGKSVVHGPHKSVDLCVHFPLPGCSATVVIPSVANSTDKFFVATAINSVVLL